jgi:hypothetical protein
MKLNSFDEEDKVNNLTCAVISLDVNDSMELYVKVNSFRNTEH